MRGEGGEKRAEGGREERRERREGGREEIM